MLDRAGRVINLALSQRRCSPRMGIKKLNPDTTKCDATPSDFLDFDTETVKNSEPIPPPRIRQKLTEKENDNSATKPPTPLSVSTASHVSSLAENSFKLPHPVPQPIGQWQLPAPLLHP